MEIVSEPDMRTPEEAGAYLRRLHDVLVYLGVCDGNMEEGSFRCDANVSVRPKGQAEFGTKAELKNMNSFRNVEKALEYEIRRQVELIEDGGKVVQETRLWDANAGVTVSMRRKEEAHDYRYFPDPDLLPLVVEDAWVERLRGTIPELPGEKVARLVREYGIPEYDAGILSSSRALADFFEASVALFKGAPKTTANECVHWKDAVLAGKLSPETIAHAVEDRENGTISATASKKLVEAVLETGKPFRTLAGRKGAHPGFRRLGARRRRRQGPRGQPEGGRKLPGRQDGAALVLRRAGDEGEPGKGQPEDRARGAEEKAGVRAR